MNKRTFLKNGLLLAGGGLLARSTTASSTTPATSDSSATPYTNYPVFNDLTRHAFSASGSRLNLKYADAKNRRGLRIKTLRYRAVTNKWDEEWAGDYYDVELLEDRRSVDFSLEQSPWSLKLTGASGGTAEIIFSAEDTLLFRTEGAGLRLRPLQGYRWLDPRDERQTVLLTSGARTFHYFLSEQANFLKFRTEREADVEEAVKNAKITAIESPEGTHHFLFRETAFEERTSPAIPSPDQARKNARQRVASWMERMPQVPEAYAPVLRTAWFYLHNYQVSPSEFITRPTLLCSKNSWLTKVWAWDHCFHGLALALGDYERGWDQIKVFFDNQLPNGGLPEPLSDLMRQTGFVKPPVHGWAIGELMRQGGKAAALPHVRELYRPLERFTEFWFEYYGGHQHGLCYYRHGNDSGWDNATAFDQGLPTHGADLAAYLVLQMEVLAEMADWLG
ncbi:MAG: hypothetical protein AAFN92_18210, partial [Bacteroidota bacterium]